MTDVKTDLGLEKVTIYILKLEENKYYVGRSKKTTEKGVKARINQHFQKGPMV